jgi:hypothetical protein
MIFPPLGGAVSIKEANRDIRDRIANGFLASLMCNGNDVQHHNNVALFSGPYVSAGALSVTDQNFEKAMLIHGVRRVVHKSWVNDRDQFLKPNKKPSADFVRDCVIWGLFAQSNQTASLRNVRYRGNTYQIENHFFPLSVVEMKEWSISDSDIAKSLLGDSRNRFMSGWLDSHDRDSLTSETLLLGKQLYRLFFEEFKNLPTSRYKIEHWDAGWFQVKRCLVDASLGADQFAELQRLRDKLAERIRQQTLDYGILATV